MIYPFSGDYCGVHHNKHYLLCEWAGPGRVVFSYCRRGNAIVAHFAAKKDGLRYIKKAINEFFDYLLRMYKWCTMVLSISVKPSVVRLIKKCGFEHIGDIAGGKEHTYFYARAR